MTRPPLSKPRYEDTLYVKRTEHPMWRGLAYASFFNNPDINVITDLSGNDNHATATNLLPFSPGFSDTDGRGVESSTAIDNTSHRYDLGSITSTNPLALRNSANFTIFARVYYDTAVQGSFPRILDKSDGGNAANGWGFWFNDRTIVMGIDGTTSSYLNGLAAGGAWRNVYIARTGGNVTIISGEGGSVTNSFSRAFPTDTTNAALFNWNHSTDRGYVGIFDAMYVWNRYYDPDLFHASLIEDPYQLFRPRDSITLDEQGVTVALNNATITFGQDDQHDITFGAPQVNQNNATLTLDGKTHTIALGAVDVTQANGTVTFDGKAQTVALGNLQVNQNNASVTFDGKSHTVALGPIQVTGNNATLTLDGKTHGVALGNIQVNQANGTITFQGKTQTVQLPLGVTQNNARITFDGKQQAIGLPIALAQNNASITFTGRQQVISLGQVALNQNNATLTLDGKQQTIAASIVLCPDNATIQWRGKKHIITGPPSGGGASMSEQAFRRRERAQLAAIRADDERLLELLQQDGFIIIEHRD